MTAVSHQSSIKFVHIIHFARRDFPVWFSSDKCDFRFIGCSYYIGITVRILKVSRQVFMNINDEILENIIYYFVHPMIASIVWFNDIKFHLTFQK